MEKKRLYVYAGAIALFLLILFIGMWFWSLGAVASEEVQTVFVEVAQDPVERRAANSDNWEPVSGSTLLHAGDRVRTLESGEAQIRWGDRGVTRLDPESEVLIENAERGEALFQTSLRLRVESGRIWNRLLKVLDVDGGMEIETSDVVATVRGTAFGLGKNEGNTDLAVTESVVSVPFALIREGQWGAFNASGTIEMRQLTDADTWATTNQEKDREFDRMLKETVDERMKSRANKSAPVWLLRLSEVLHLSLVAGDKKKNLAENYALRHLAFAMLKENKRDAHLKSLVARAETAGAHVDRLMNEVHANALLLSAERYRFEPASRELVVELRAIRSAIAVTGASQRLYTRAIQIDDQIDDYLFDPEAGETSGARDILTALADFVGGIEENENLSEEERSLLFRKAEAMAYRLGFEGFEAGSGLEFDDGEVLSDIDSAADLLEEPGANELKNEEVTQGEVDGQIRQFQFYASPIRVKTQEPVKLSLYGITAEGVALNLTKDTTFGVVSPAQGSFQQNYFTPATAGTVTLIATYGLNGESKTFTTNIEVEEGVQVKEMTDVRFAFQGSTSMACDSRVPFTLNAYYSDGTTANVTTLGNYSVSNPNLIYVADAMVVSYCPNQATSAEVYGTYEEGGVRFTAVGVMTVAPESPSAPNGQGAGGAGGITLY